MPSVRLTKLNLVNNFNLESVLFHPVKSPDNSGLIVGLNCSLMSFWKKLSKTGLRCLTCIKSEKWCVVN